MNQKATSVKDTIFSWNFFCFICVCVPAHSVWCSSAAGTERSSHKPDLSAPTPSCETLQTNRHIHTHRQTPQYDSVPSKPKIQY